MADLADVLKLMLSNEAALDALRDAEPLQRRANSTALDRRRLQASVLPDFFVLETLSPATPQSLCTADEERASARVRSRVAGVTKACRGVVNGATWPPPSPAFRSRSLARATCYFQLAMILRYNHLMAEDDGNLARLCTFSAPPRATLCAGDYGAAASAWQELEGSAPVVKELLLVPAMGFFFYVYRFRELLREPCTPYRAACTALLAYIRSQL